MRKTVSNSIAYRLRNTKLPRTHLLAVEPFKLSATQTELLTRLGNDLLKFYRAVNDLYLHSNIDWVRDYLDIGKGDDLIRHARMKYHKQSIPRIIRPDILITNDGFVITELDSIPGGFGQLDSLSAVYEDAGYNIVGSARGVHSAFASSLCEASGLDDPVCAIVVSDESADYLPEMTYLAVELQKIGLQTHAVHPKEVLFTEDSLFINVGGGKLQVDIVYRFFELFDLPNIPKSELLLYAARKKLMAVTPPCKHFLEEKILLALLHNEYLRDYWTNSLGNESFTLLKNTIAPTWIMDNRIVPPHAEVSGFRWRGKPIRDWREIIDGTQNQRRLVLKPSGFSPLAWGSKGVKIGHDMPKSQWAETVETALMSFETSPYVIQPFCDTALFDLEYFDYVDTSHRHMEARVRLCPYYFVYNNRANLGGVLATACSKDKKVIHGMTDAIMMPCQSNIT
ncbi:MAG: hypothetical protein ABFD49_07810 [Armatimonadota bacterium]|nr:hypothetical protein [bacterium]